MEFLVKLRAPLRLGVFEVISTHKTQRLEGSKRFGKINRGQRVALPLVEKSD
jgi:hypothetical protein